MNKSQSVRSRPFRAEADGQLVWDLLTDVYAPRFTNGVPAPFFEYALTSSWLDKRFLDRNRLWLDGDTPVGFVFYEEPVTRVFFHLRAGYEALSEEMIAWAEEGMPGETKEKELMLFSGQTALTEAAKARGYALSHSEEDLILDFKKDALDYPLPDGFHFLPPGECDPVKLARCTWKGFGHEDKGPFENWDAEDPGTPWNPQKAYRGVLETVTNPPPHATQAYSLIIADAQGEYACFSGMWWVPKNKLAYMEPLCTIPEYRRRGLAAAALTRHYQRMKALGAEWMTGGGDPFYRRIGYRDTVEWLSWKVTIHPTDSW